MRRSIARNTAKREVRAFIQKVVEQKKMTICHIDRMCELSSIFGNAYVAVTDNDIEKLKSGEALHFECAEYGIFLGYVVEEKKGR